MAAKVSVGEEASISTPARPAKKEANKVKRPATMEEGFQKMFLEPSLKEMSEGLNDVMKQMDDYCKNLDEEREKRWEAARKQHSGRQDIPSPIANSGKKLEEVVNNLEALIIHGDPESQDLPKAIPPKNLSKASHVSMLGQSVAAYCTTLGPSHLRKLTTRIISDTTLWMSRIFRFDDSSAYYHNDDREGLVRVCRLALNAKYEKFATEGFNALYTKPPIIYISAASRPGLGQFVCTQLGLPLSSLCTVPCNTMFGSQHTMDIATLERLIKDDEGSSKTPLLVVANAGTPLAGHTDNINRLRAICDDYGVWLHAEGHNLSTLALSTVPSSILAAKRVNSMTISPGVWLGLPGTPAVTLYKTADPAMSLAAGLCSSQIQERLCCLPLWLSLQHLGYDGIVQKLKHAADLSQHMSQRLHSIGAINIAVYNAQSCLGKEKQEKKQQTIQYEGSLTDVVRKVIQVLSQVDVVSPVVVFRYEDPHGPGLDKAPYANDSSDDTSNHTLALPKPIVNAFNTWLGTELNKRIPDVGIDVVDLETDGVCLRFSPMQSAPYNGTSADDIDNFVECLKQLLTVLNYSNEQRPGFQEAVECRENLIYVDIQSHGGLGVVQFVPEYVSSNKNEEQNKKELIKLNGELVQRLQAGETGALYFAVPTEAETVAVGVGMVNPGTDLDEVVDLIWVTGKELEDSSKFLETMTDLVLKGIEEAQKELEKENENKLIEEGVLRQIPIVGSLWSWYSPPPKEAQIKGRALNLSSGALESTENTYKYHMQVQQDKPTTPTRKTAPRRKTPSTTPTPSVDGDHSSSEKPLQKRDLEETPMEDGQVGDGLVNSHPESGNSSTTGTTTSSFQEVSPDDLKEIQEDGEADDKDDDNDEEEEEEEEDDGEDLK
ncbi:putative pyridoxal-dependent decarboxylase domain-containing protein 2 isoform X3 [Amphiura filiformis]|uniref:putative pyridoxal-dependent decarboxylase domain-containing protein 2 isoform X3 n=1 Tax=Amphiura filiformis TaxID=82378 RepID=UPI003B227B82